MRGFIDLHSHWVPGIDDGARSIEEGIDMLRRLRAAGFDRVVATPHMRPGMFENDRADITGAFERAACDARLHDDVPVLETSSEHYFDAIVYDRLTTGSGVPYPGGRAALLEFYDVEFPLHVDRQLARLRSEFGMIPVIAHPERYRCLWTEPQILERLLDVGAVALLDAAAVVGKYGKRPERCARDLLDAGLYHAACSDAHRPADVEEVSAGMDWIAREYGDDEVLWLFRDGPREILEGNVSP